MQIRLNGCQRIGIVLSVIWFIGFAGYRINKDIVQAAEQYGKVVGEICVEHNISDQTCGKQQFEATQKMYAAIREDKVLEIILAMDFGTVVLGWLVAWFGIVAGRWIKRGSA